MIQNKEQAAQEYVDSFECIDTYKGVNGLSTSKLVMDAFIAGFEKVFEMASDGFDEFISDPEKINPLHYYNPALSGWQASRISIEKEIQEFASKASVQLSSIQERQDKFHDQWFSEVKRNQALEAENKKLRSMIDNGLGWEDLKNDI